VQYCHVHTSTKQITTYKHFYYKAIFFAQRTVLSDVDLTYWNGKVAHMGRITNLGNLGLHLPERSGRFLNLLEPLLHFVELLLLCTRTGQQ